jgi:solute carrier family 44 (choline transporter-like protein), member 2/4/5|eukprot:Stramenopile-MAST_4_protein_4639
MCKKKVADESFDGKEAHHITDIIPLVVFLACCFAGVVVGIVGVNSGNPESLLYGTDYKGVTCGSKNTALKACPYDGSNCDMTERVMTYYPRLNDDIIVMIDDNKGSFPTDPNTFKFTGVCMKSCPKANQWVCTDYILAEKGEKLDGDGALSTTFVATLNGCKTGNENVVVASAWAASSATAECKTLMGQCWKTPVPTKETFFRCFAKKEENITYGCDNNADGVVDGALRSTAYTPAEAADCQTMLKSASTTESAQKDYLAEQIQTFGAIFGRYLGDVKNSVLVIGVAGIGISVMLGFVWLFILRKFAKCFVWTIVVMVLLLHVIITLFFLLKAGIIENTTGVESDTLAVDPAQKELWEAIAYVMAVVTIIQFALVAYFGKKINIAATIIQEASKAIAAMPMLVVFPILPCLLIVGLIGWFVYCGAALYTMKAVDTASVGLADTALKTLQASNSTNAVVISENALKDYLLVFHFFMFLWGNQFIQGFALMTISGAVSLWYFREFEENEPRDDAHRTLHQSPICTSFKRTVFYHLGSVALGSFLVAIVQFLRAVLAYLDQQTQGAQKKNCAMRVVFKVVACLLWCFEKSVKYITRSAYVIVALRSYTFCGAAMAVFGILKDNLSQIGLVITINAYLMLLGKLVIDLGCVATAYLWLSYDPAYTDTTKTTYVSNIIFPLIVTAAVAHGVASVFLTVYDMAIETILIDFCIDKEKNKANGNYFMSDDLKKYMDHQQKVNEAHKAVGSSGDDGEKQDAVSRPNKVAPEPSNDEEDETDFL